MKNYILILFLFISAGVQSKGKTGFTIRGEILSKTIPSYIARLTYKRFVSSWLNNERVVECKIKNNRFQFHLDDLNEIGYIKVALIDSTNAVGSQELLVEPGDDIFMKINKSKYTSGSPDLMFTGKGAEKLNFQHNVNTITGQLGSKLLKRTSTMTDGIELNVMIKDSIKTACLELLKLYKTKISQEVFEIFKFDIKCVGPCEFTTLLVMNLPKNDAIELLDKYKDYVSIRPHTEFIANKSKYYADFLIWKEMTNSKRGTGEVNELRYIYPTLFSNITEKYSGIIRDKVLAILCTEVLKDDVQYYRDSALKIVKTKMYKDIILNSKLINGLAFYNFKLEDINGKIFSLSDFKDKVVVLDFYFNGCENCTKLAENIKPVKAKFENNSNVVFVSINVDRTKAIFQDAIKSGLYTDDKSINLWTNIKGQNHEIIKYYRFNGYPQFFILDKKGMLLEANPPIPLYPSDPNVIKLIEIIDNGIKMHI